MELLFLAVFKGQLALLLKADVEDSLIFVVELNVDVGDFTFKVNVLLTFAETSLYSSLVVKAKRERSYAALAVHAGHTCQLLCADKVRSVDPLCVHVLDKHVIKVVAIIL